MILKVLEKGSTKVYAPDDQVADYLFLGFTDTGTTTEVVVTDPSKEIVEMKIEDDVVTAFRYKGDPVWRTVAGGGGGTDTYKVKVDGTDTAEYLENKLQQGTNVTITKSGGKLVVNSTGGSGGGVTVYADLAAIKAVNTTAVTSGTLAQVVTLGQFVFNSTSTATGNDVTVVQPTTGSGRWLRQSTSDIDTKETLELYVAPATQENVTTRNIYEKNTTDVNGRKMINKQIPATRSKKIVFVGSSVASGQNATVPLTQAYAKLLEVDMIADTRESWTLSKNCVLGESVSAITSSTSLRFWNNIALEKPDLVWLGYAPWNDMLNTQTSFKDAEKRIVNYEQGIAHAVAYCKQIGADYRIMGTYTNGQNNGDVTIYAQAALLQHNKRMCDTYKNKYINLLGSVANEVGLVWKATVFGNAGHPSTWGHKIFYYCTDLINFRCDKEEPSHLFKMGKNQLLIGNETTISEPIYISNEGYSTASEQVKISSFYFEVENKNGASANKVLARLTNASSGSTEYTIIETDASGYIVVRSNSTNTIALQTAVTLPAGKNKIYVECDTADLKVRLYLNNTLLGSFTRIEGWINVREWIIGGDKLVATKNAVGYAFSNVAIWRGVLNKYERDLLHTEGYICPSNLVYFNDFNLDPVAYKALKNFGVEDALGIINSTLITRVINTEDAVGTAVASATTITVPANKTIFHVTGTTAISTINLPYTGFTGQITIIPDAIFTLATGGNIAEAYTAVVNRAIVLTYDGTSWYRVNS